MKELLNKIKLLGIMLGITVSAHASPPVVGNFLLCKSLQVLTNLALANATGCSNTLVWTGPGSNGSTTNVFYIANGMNGSYSFNTNYIYPTIDTNGVYWYTNTLTWTNGASGPNTIGGGFGGLATNSVMAPFPWNDVSLFSDVNADPAQIELGIAAHGLYPSETNLITLVFTRKAGTSFVSLTETNGLVGGGPSINTGISAGQNQAYPVFDNTTPTGQFVVSFHMQGYGLTGFTTNLPTTFTQGATDIRLQQSSIATNLNASTPSGIGGNGTYIDYIGLRGFKP